MNSVVVLGAGGRTGKLIVAEAAQRGHAVTAAVRRPETVRDLATSFRGQASLARVDVRDSAQTALALAGHYAVVCAVSAKGRDPRGLYSAAARSVVAATRQEGGPRRLVFVSSAGANRTDPALPWWYRRIAIPLVMHRMYDDMAEMEALVQDSDTEWTLVRPGYLGDHHARHLRVRDGANPRGGWRTSRAALASFVVDQLDSREWLRRIPTLAE